MFFFSSLLPHLWPFIVSTSVDLTIPPWTPEMTVRRARRPHQIAEKLKAQQRYPSSFGHTMQFNWIGCIHCGDLPGLCMWLHLICSPRRKSGLSQWSRNEPLLKLNSMAAILRAAFHLTYYLRRRKCSRMCFKFKGRGSGGFSWKRIAPFICCFGVGCRERLYGDVSRLLNIMESVGASIVMLGNKKKTWRNTTKTSLSTRSDPFPPDHQACDCTGGNMHALCSNVKSKQQKENVSPYCSGGVIQVTPVSPEMATTPCF